jgi:hypothetical protein
LQCLSIHLQSKCIYLQCQYICWQSQCINWQCLCNTLAMLVSLSLCELWHSEFS